MTTRIVAATLAAVTLAGAAGAQEFKGAELSVESLSFSEGDIASTTYRASVEMGVYGGFGVAADLNFYDFGVDDDGLSNFTLHALYDAFEFATVGAFYAQDSSDDATATTFGVEAGRSFGAAGIEGFLGFVDDEGVDYRILGADGAFDIGRNFSLTGSTAFLSADEASVSRISVGGEYRFGDAGPALYAEVGRLNVDEETTGFGESSTYLGLGARIAVGPNRGTTFESRGVYEAVAGF
jgi:hypothetical protein